MSSGPWSELLLACPRCRTAMVADASGAACEACGARYPTKDGILRLALGREGAPGYDPHFFHTLEQVEERHFWFVARREVVLTSLRRVLPDLQQRRLFDIGCGSGGLLRFLAGRGVTIAGACDAYLQGLELVRDRLESPLVLVDEGRLPPLAAGHDLIAMFDVLEHVDDDRGMLRFVSSVLTPGGALALTVPAHPLLFNELDEMACHRRRYRRAELRAKLVEAGLEVQVLSHFMTPLVPLLLLAKARARLVPSPRPRTPETLSQDIRVVPVLNGLMAWLLSVERHLLRRVSLPFGSSIVAIASRPRRDVDTPEAPPMIALASGEGGRRRA